MHGEIQKASMWKRFAAWLLDVILVVILVTGMFTLLSGWFGFDRYTEKIEAVVDRYEEKYELNYELTQEEFAALPEAEQQAYNDRLMAADEELQNTPADIQVYMEVTVVLLAIVTTGILAAMLLLEFSVPLLLKNGQTVGKKIFSLAVIRQDSIKISPLQLFMRMILGKFAVETMIPVCIGIMYLMGFMNLFLLLLLAAIVIGQLVCVAVTKNNCLLHDLMAGTVVADYSSQMIFSSAQAKEEYEEKHRQENRQTY